MASVLVIKYDAEMMCECDYLYYLSYVLVL